MKKKIIFLLKLSITFTMVYIVLQKADLRKIEAYIQQADMFYLIAALIALNIGQIVSGLRMRYYFASVGHTLSRTFSISLYYVGMLFNLILPGGIGGDGYKAYHLKKNMEIPWKTSLRVIISGRASGLLLLIAFTIITAFFSPYIMTFPYAEILLISGFALLFPCYSICTKILLRESVKTQIGAVKYSAFVQGMVIVTSIFLLKSLGYNGDIVNYVVLFMISSIMSVIPITIGGIGLRELTFFYGAVFLQLDSELGVTISVLYFVINALASLIGVIFFYLLKGSSLHL